MTAGEQASLATSRADRPFPLVYAATSTRHCDEEQVACFKQCWERYPPYPVERGNKGQHIHCTTKCLEAYTECVKEAEAKPLSFPTKKAALEWIEEHRTEIVVGSLVFIGGAAFVIGTGGAGALVLLPVIAL